MQNLILALFFIGLLTQATWAQFDLGSSDAPQVKQESTSSSSSSASAEETVEKIKTVACNKPPKERKSILSRYLLQALFKNRDRGQFNFEQTNGYTKAKVTSSEMISNCESLIQYGLKEPNGDRGHYIFEAEVTHSDKSNAKTVASSEECTEDPKCNCYRLDKKDVPTCRFTILSRKNGGLRKEEYNHFFSLDIHGLNKCLVDSGAVNPVTKKWNDGSDDDHPNQLVYDKMPELKDQPANVSGDIKCRSHDVLFKDSAKKYVACEDGSESCYIQDGCYVYEPCGKYQDLNFKTYTEVNIDNLMKRNDDRFNSYCKDNNYDALLAGSSLSQFNNYILDPEVQQYITNYKELEKKAGLELLLKNYENYVSSIEGKRGDDKDLESVDLKMIKEFISKVLEPQMDKMANLSDIIYDLDDGKKYNGNKSEYKGKNKEELEELLKKEEEILKSYAAGDYFKASDKAKVLKSNGFDLALEINYITDSVKAYTFEGLMSKKGPSGLDKQIKKSGEAYEDAVDEIEDKAERRSGDRPYDGVKYYAKATAQLGKIEDLIRKEQMESQQLVRNAQMRCGRELQHFGSQLNATSDKVGSLEAIENTGCIPFDDLVEMKLHYARLMVEAQEKADEYEALAKVYDEDHAYAAANDEEVEVLSKSERLRAFEKYNRKYKSENSISSYNNYNNQNPYSHNRFSQSNMFMQQGNPYSMMQQNPNMMNSMYNRYQDPRMRSSMYQSPMYSQYNRGTNPLMYNSSFMNPQFNMNFGLNGRMNSNMYNQGYNQYQNRFPAYQGQGAGSMWYP